MATSRSRLSSLARDFVPASALGHNGRLRECLKFSGNVANSSDAAFNSRYQLNQSIFPIISGHNAAAPGYVNNRPYSPFGFANLPNSVLSNSPVTNTRDGTLIRPFSPQVASSSRQPRSMDDLFDNFSPASIESEVHAIWKDAEVANPISRIRKSSLCSDMFSSSDGEDYVNYGVGNQFSMSRKIVGRGLSYYEKYGKECLPVPIDASINYPLDRKVVSPFKSGKVNPRNKKNSKKECAFCKSNAISNGDSDETYKTHWLKNNKNIVTCPVLRAYTCPLCLNPGGDNAHTMRYCPSIRKHLAEEYQRTKNVATSAQAPPNRQFANRVSSHGHFLADDAIFGRF